MTPKVKEPSFFFSGEGYHSAILKDILSPGNNTRGVKWFFSLYKKSNSNDSLMIDMSTQYWLHAKEVIDNALKDYDPTFFIIKRNSEKQLISYISHLRRGHIKNVLMRDLCAEDELFSNYLNKMYQWSKYFEQIKSQYPEVNFIELTFEELISKPFLCLKKLVPEIEDEIENTLDYGVHKNPMSYPRFTFFNKLVFSKSTKLLGRIMPNFLYSSLINLRKKIVKINLKAGEGKFFSSDQSFINQHYTD